ncbi:ABC transporter substrate-binding protein [Entomobacter blattae]|uniref:Periplasmic binding protein n=1 Tax=Entomobacter blattae TaxID=2762277 RepID=A0A7H1NRW0_9PROT|nr:ABC transporter substrate-binding protein [Entomobacter blattae]QNT78520.1 Periplasmic binding protein [Entomobacter blattae]
MRVCFEQVAKGVAKSAAMVMASVAVLSSVLSSGGALAAETVKDISGREVVIPDHVNRIVLGEGRLIYAMALLEGKNPFQRIVGWQGEFRKADQQNYDQYVKRFPQVAHIPLIGKNTADSVSSEKVLELKPDLVILSLVGHGPGPSSQLVSQLDAAHIPYVFVNFRTQPVAETVPSMLILGKALHREKEAQAYVDFYQAHLNHIREGVAKLSAAQKPTVFIEMLAGAREGCCHTAGNGNMGAFIEAAGGRNIAKDKLPGVIGELSLEAVIAANPDIYLADGTKSPAYTGGGIRMGAEVSQALARSSFLEVLKRPGISTLRAVKDGKAYALWHSFYDSPYNIIAIEVMAHWFHPDIFKDVNPQKTAEELYNRFLSIPFTGTYWVAAKP